MREFFHSDTQKYIKRRKYILWLALLPLFQGSVITALIWVVNLRAFYEKGYHAVVIYAVVVAALLGSALFFVVSALTEKAVKRHARYTFFEIGTKSLIYSRYSCDYVFAGRLTVYRRLCVVPLSGLKSVGYCEKSGKVFLEADKEGVREYYDTSERLKYTISGGTPDFESWWYNENGFKTLQILEVPRIFGEPVEFCEKIAEAKRAFDNLPEPTPYVHREPEFVKRKKAMDRLKKTGLN